MVCFGTDYALTFRGGARLVAGSASAQTVTFMGEPQGGTLPPVDWDGLTFHDVPQGASSVLTNVVLERPSHGIETDAFHAVRVLSSVIHQANHTALRLFAPGSQFLESTVDVTRDMFDPAVELGDDSSPNPDGLGILFKGRVRGAAADAIHVFYPNVTIRGCEILSSAKKGIVVESNLSLVFITGCNLVGNGDLAVKNLGQTTVGADDDWWGQAGGPGPGTANGVSGEVNVTTPRSTPASVGFAPPPGPSVRISGLAVRRQGRGAGRINRRPAR